LYSWNLAGANESALLAAFGAESLNLQEVALHLRFEMALNIFGYFFHQTQIDFFNFATFAADEVVMMSGFNIMAYEIAQLAVFIRSSKKNPATSKTVQNSINRGQADAFELLLQPGLHFKGIKEAPAFEK
jgi:hypothetical protein